MHCSAIAAAFPHNPANFTCNFKSPHPTYNFNIFQNPNPNHELAMSPDSSDPNTTCCISGSDEDGSDNGHNHLQQDSGSGITLLYSEPEQDPWNLPAELSQLKQCLSALAEGRKKETQSMLRSLKLKIQKLQSSSVLQEWSERLLLQFVRSLEVMATTGEKLQQRCISDICDEMEMEKAFLTFNQVMPCVRFAHLTANQAILESLEATRSATACVHIIDFEMMGQGLQWPLLMQALSDRGRAPSKLRISRVGLDHGNGRFHTGRRLSAFAQELGLSDFEYRTVSSVKSLDLRPGEAIAVNCVSFPSPCSCVSQSSPCKTCANINLQTSVLSHFLTNPTCPVRPIIFTLSERPCLTNPNLSHNRNHNPISDSDFSSFDPCFRHYAALFDALDATLPLSNHNRLTLENTLFRSEIMASLSSMSSSDEPMEWREMLISANARRLHPSAFSSAQAKTLLRLHYPSQSYSLEQLSNRQLVLGWRHTPLISISTWSLITP